MQSGIISFTQQTLEDLLMLEITLNGSILTVVQSTFGFRKTQREYWYHDIQNWMVSSHGKEGDVPDRKMTDRDIAWVTQYYLPKVMKNPVEAPHSTQLRSLSKSLNSTL